MQTLNTRVPLNNDILFPTHSISFPPREHQPSRWSTEIAVPIMRARGPFDLFVVYHEGEGFASQEST